MHNIVICSIASLFFNCVDGMQIRPQSAYIPPLQVVFSFTTADKEIQDIVDQGVHDFQIDQPVGVVKQDMGILDQACGATVAVCSDKQTKTDVCVISYSPWKGMPEAVENKRPFLFNYDLADPFSFLDDFYLRRDKPHPAAQKFAIYHELAHIKNGDLDDRSDSNNYLKANLFMIKAIRVVGVAASLLFACLSNSSPKIKGMVAAGVGFLTHGLASNKYYYGYLANKRNREFMADAAACEVLLQKKDLNSIVHRVLEQSFEQDYSFIESTPDSHEKNIGSTHPTHFERIQLCIDALRYGGLVWTRQLYDEIQKELDEDEHKAEKLVYLNQLHHMLLAGQNKNPIPLAWQKAKYKKFLQRDVLDGYLRGSVYEQVVKWKK